MVELRCRVLCAVEVHEHVQRAAHGKQRLAQWDQKGRGEVLAVPTDRRNRRRREARIQGKMSKMTRENKWNGAETYRQVKNAREP